MITVIDLVIQSMERVLITLKASLVEIHLFPREVGSTQLPSLVSSRKSLVNDP